ncbi:bifunctional phosphopantothenoylcysteine decarboxylase/phosphopantothenate--cysteine ligase CoaBC [Cellulosilyticum sp. I15G10I2]|uniref:bifunctional phosphopantothenoylcysteine decarboxylase/phosphopantothenate--cysteine ligase CoaBC n=1 Tax=Cellulosilyticum sp. I15G10I2 TaxID=1892843 RepID=UPI00085C41CA|nr:bifunctional phosphopantothenoylcysteine decarboxylase/phosphopantothenate--cysteine ligase CoaBC [Cellulosilyticum sp. I15G10I2]
MKKNVVIGVTGGIAAYKALDIVSALRKKDINIDVIMSENACEFVTPLSFESLSNNAVVTDTFNRTKSWEIEHIALAKKADLFLIAPATANIIGKVAHGIADDMLSTTIMAARCPIVFAPAMNTFMYENAIVQENINSLKGKGYHFIEPDSGRLACGDLGKGKLQKTDIIVEEVMNYLETTKELEGINILVTAGPTVEKIDPMRYITNHSSGKMGYAIAEAAVRRGASVKLVSGPTHLQTPYKVERIDIESALEMYEAVHEHFEWADVVIKAAAVADYRPLNVSEEKIKKSGDDIALALTRNPDILQSLGSSKGNKILVGFAAETKDITQYAVEKIKNKNLDFIVANNIKEEHAGFKGDTNIAAIINKDGTQTQYPVMSKLQLAHIILDRVKLSLFI